MDVRRFQACLAVMLGYLLLAWFALVLLWAATGRGDILADLQQSALRIALIGHTLAAAVVGLIYRATRSATVVPPWTAKVALALMPFGLLISIDRITAVSFPGPLELGIYQSHPLRGWTNRPGSVDRLGEEEIRINAKGLRGPDISWGKAESETRILFLGDSITFAFGVAERDGFVRRVEGLFARTHAEKRVTTINCSVISYSPWQQLDLLRTECMNYEPDLVVLVFCLNDVVEKYNLRRFGGLTRGLEPADRTLLDSSGLYQISRLTVVEWMTGTMASVRQRRRQYSVERLLTEPTAPEFEEAWRSTLENVEAIHLLTREKSVPLAIVCFPYAEQLSPHDPYEDTPQDRIRAFAASRGVAFLDLAPMYRAYCRRPDVLAATGREWEGLALFPDRVHPTPEGHGMAAEAIHAMVGRVLWPETR